MTTATLPSPLDSNPLLDPPTTRLNIPKVGMMVFLASEAMLFAGLLAGYLVLFHGHTDQWIAEGYPSIVIQLEAIEPLQWLMIANTVILVSSSFTYHFGEAAVLRGKSGLGWFALTSLFGAIFLFVQAYEWMHLAEHNLWFGKWSQEAALYGGSFFVLTGFHGLHVAIGLVMVLVALYRSVKRLLGIKVADHVWEEIAALYWHFVDGVWILVFFLLYLWPAFFITAPVAGGGH